MLRMHVEPFRSQGQYYVGDHSSVLSLSFHFCYFDYGTSRQPLLSEKKRTRPFIPSVEQIHQAGAPTFPIENLIGSLLKFEQ